MSGTDAMRMKQCVTGLERTERYVVLMYFADDLTPAEIGEVLDVSLGRVADILDAFRQTAADAIGLAGQQHDAAQQFALSWLSSSHSAVS